MTYADLNKRYDGAIKRISHDGKSAATIELMDGYVFQAFSPKQAEAVIKERLR